MTSAFTGADAAAAQAYFATAKAVVHLRASTETLEAHLELCSEFADDAAALTVVERWFQQRDAS